MVKLERYEQFFNSRQLPLCRNAASPFLLWNFLAHKGECFANKENTPFFSLVPTHVALALYLRWWRIYSNLCHCEPCLHWGCPLSRQKNGELWGPTQCTQAFNLCHISAQIYATTGAFLFFLSSFLSQN